ARRSHAAARRVWSGCIAAESRVGRQELAARAEVVLDRWPRLGAGDLHDVLFGAASGGERHQDAAAGGGRKGRLACEWQRSAPLTDGHGEQRAAMREAPRSMRILRVQG